MGRQRRSSAQDSDLYAEPEGVMRSTRSLGHWLCRTMTADFEVDAAFDCWTGVDVDSLCAGARAQEAEINRLRRIETLASHCRQYMQHLGWCSSRGNGQCTCERDEDYAELMVALTSTVARGPSGRIGGERWPGCR